MASGTARTTVTPPPVADDRRTSQVIERQLGRARFHVKLVDLLCHVAILLVGTLVYLLVAAIADHWLLPGGLGFTGRTLAFAGLLLLVAWFLVRQLGPLLLRGINPTYAARAIEEAQPSLKNSLINFLLLRHDRAGVREAVFDAVEQKAASDIAKVQVESAVDRSPMIRVGYVLVGVLVLCVAYKILSPKDPFQTAARVALPWADIARPSRVQILEVTPGNTKVYHGHTASVTATIDGASEDSPVWLVYSTADGQTVDRKLRMKAKPGGLQFDGILPPEEDESPALQPGLQQDVIYRVEAGDAVSAEYRLSVVAAPTIVVQQLQYEFPAYTGKPRQTLDKQGDIQAIEGTKVTIHAAANQPIQSAYLELDPNDSPLGAAEILPLQFEGQRAWGTIALAMDANRTRPWHTSYQVRFVNEDGNKSEQPIRHQIDVQRDLPPEVQILAPSERRIEVPENSSRLIELRAVDPDFGLTRLALVGEVGGKQVLSEELLKTDGTPPPQAIAKYVFAPQRLGLKAGDELIYVALAADNRTNAAGSAEPNEATTSSHVIVVVPPVEQPRNPAEPPPEGEKPPPMEGEQPLPQDDRPPMPMDDQRQPMADKTDQPQQGEKQGEKSQQPMQGEKQGEKGEQGDKSQQPKQGKNEKGSSKSGGEKNQDQKGGGEKSDQQKSEGADDQQQGSDSSEKGSKGQSQSGGGKGQKSSGNPDQENPADGAAGESSSAGSTRGTPSGNASEPSGNQGEAGDNSGNPSGASDQPTRPAHDGDAIERINKLRQQREQAGQPATERHGSDMPPDGSASPMPDQQGDQKDAGTGQDPKTDSQRPGAEGSQQEGSQSESEKTAGSKSAKGGKGSEKQTDDSQGEGSEGKDDPSGVKSTQPKSAAGKKGGEKRGGEEGAGEKTAAADPAGAKQPGSKQDKGTGGADKDDGEGTKKDAAGGQGGNPQGPMKTEKAGEPQPGNKGQKKEPGMGKNGESGAGDASKNEKGSGDSQETNRDTKKNMGPDSSEPKESDPSTPSGSKKQSDSQGNDSGDKSGGGKSGAGQSSKQAGNDAAGSNSPGDEGAGAAQEKGKGETGTKGGNQKKANGQTGAKGSEKGDGSGSKEGKGDAAGGAPPDGQKQKSDGDGRGEGSQGTGGTIPTGGGAPGERGPGQQGTGEVADSDDANLEYAKKQTELALEYLKDQEHDPDPELLDRLGWTKDEMQEFLRRWESLQKAAAEDPKASHELDESLRSLGLTPAKNRKQIGGNKSDNTRDLRDSGSRTSAPKSYRDQFDNFRKGSR